MTDMRVVLLLFLMKAALATSSLFVVTGLGLDIAEVFEEKMEPELHYKRLGLAHGHYWFLYTDSRRPQTWIIGHGKTLSTARADYRAPARAGRPALTQWSWVVDGSREGKEEGDPRPSIRVMGVETNVTGEELAKQIQGWEDIFTEEYIVCKNYLSDLQIIIRNSSDPAYCNGVADCESGADELCPILIVRDK